MIPRLHLVTDDDVVGDPRFGKRTRAAMRAGGGRVAVHVRGPSTSGRDLWRRGSEALEAARDAGAVVIVNDRVDIALALGADGAHLGTRSLPVAVARQLLGPKALIGRSLHGPDEASHGAGADFVFVGPIYPTASHPHREGAGPRLIETVGRALPGIPLVAIGGITSDRVGDVLSAGAAGVAVIRAWWCAERPEAAVSALLERLGEGAVARTGGP